MTLQLWNLGARSNLWVFLVLRLTLLFTTAGWNAQPYSTNFGLKPDPAKIVLRQKLDLHQVSLFFLFLLFFVPLVYLTLSQWKRKKLLDPVWSDGGLIQLTSSREIVDFGSWTTNSWNGQPCFEKNSSQLDLVAILGMLICFFEWTLTWHFKLMSCFEIQTQASST